MGHGMVEYLAAVTEWCHRQAFMALLTLFRSKLNFRSFKSDQSSTLMIQSFRSNIKYHSYHKVN